MTVLVATLLDVMIALIVLASAILSWKRGFAEELVTILAWVLGLTVGIQFAEYGAQFLPEAFDEITLGERTYGLTGFHAPLAGFVLFLLTFIATSQLHRVFTRVAKEKESAVLRRSNRIMGLLFGLLRGGLLVLVLVLIAGTLPSINEAEFWDESRLIPYFVDAARLVIEWMPEDWRGHFHYPEPVEEVIETVSETVTETLPE